MSGLNFVAIADAHTQGGNLKFLPEIVERIRGWRVGGTREGETGLDFVISLGDCVYGLRENDVLADVRAYQREIERLGVPHFYALGNHEIEPIEVFENLTWEQLLEAWELPGRWYSFEARGFHCLVLDSWLALQEARFAGVLEEQLRWFEAELAGAGAPVLIFTHEALGFQQDDCGSWVEENNCNFWPPENRFLELILAHKDRVRAVFAGHKHKSLCKVIEGISFHLIAAALKHGGQIARVRIGADGECEVEAMPDWGWQDGEEAVQQTYAVRGQ